MPHFLAVLFSWPNGIVLGNLIASALWATPALLHLHRKLNRHHAQRLAQAAAYHRRQLQASKEHKCG